MNLVSVVIPCYNSGIYIEKAINSVKNQTYKNVEIIVVNDGSTDSYTLKYFKNVKNITLINQKNKGLPNARNVGIKKAKGKYILPLDADDWIRKDAIQLMVKSIQEFNCGFVFSNITLEGKKEGVHKKKFNFFEQLFINHLPYLILIKRKTLIEIGGYDEEMKHGYEDWELNIRLGKNNYFPINIEEPLFHYRVSDAGMLNSISKNLHTQIFQYIKSKHSKLYSFKSIIKIYFLWRNKGMNYNPILYFTFMLFQFIFPASINNKINIILYKIKCILFNYKVFKIK